MGLIRRPIQCLSCNARTVTRTATGYATSQQHVFPCPSCRVEIRFTLKRRKTKKHEYFFADLINAKWSKSEEGAVQILTFDSDRLAPKDTSEMFSPFLSEMSNFSVAALRAYPAEEGLRRGFRDSQWPWVQKLLVHFDNRNIRLFDKEAKLEMDSPHAKSWQTRLQLLYTFFEKVFDSFTLTRRPAQNRVFQRLALAESIDKTLYFDLVRDFSSSGRMENLWNQLNKIRRGFLQHYLTLSPLFRTLYWSQPPTDLSRFTLPDKKFDDLKNLYVDSFETLCRLTTIVLGVEAIIHHKALSIPTKKSVITLWDYEAMNNGIKHTVLGKYPIQDLFVPYIDNDLRNGIGHHAAHYDPLTDDIILHKTSGTDLKEFRLSYTVFAFKVIELYSAVELAALYFHPLHIKSFETEAL